MSREIFTKPGTKEGDLKALRELKAIFEQANIVDIIRFLEGQVNIYVVVEDVFMTRFPEEYKAWTKIFFNEEREIDASVRERKAHS